LGPAPTLIDAIAGLGAPRAYPRNTILVQEGDRSDQLYVVLAGRLKVYLDDGEGREVILDVASQPVVGPDQRRSASMRARPEAASGAAGSSHRATVLRGLGLR